jgi:hypothetical protein
MKVYICVKGEGRREEDIDARHMWDVYCRREA